MDDKGRGQVNRSAAEVYEEFFIPALFQGWTDRVADNEKHMILNGDMAKQKCCHSMEIVLMLS